MHLGSPSPISVAASHIQREPHLCAVFDIGPGHLGYFPGSPFCAMELFSLFLTCEPGSSIDCRIPCVVHNMMAWSDPWMSKRVSVFSE